MDTRSTHCYQGTSSLHNSTSPRAATTRQLHIMAIPTSLQKTGTVGHQMQWAKSPEAAVSHTAPDNTTSKHCTSSHVPRLHTSQMSRKEEYYFPHPPTTHTRSCEWKPGRTYLVSRTINNCAPSNITTKKVSYQTRQPLPCTAGYQDRSTITSFQFYKFTLR